MNRTHTAFEQRKQTQIEVRRYQQIIRVKGFGCLLRLKGNHFVYRSEPY